jgi:hypothetical protein
LGEGFSRRNDRRDKERMAADIGNHCQSSAQTQAVCGGKRYIPKIIAHA